MNLRSDDQPTRWQRVKVFMARNRALLAAVLAIAPASVALWLVLDEQKEGKQRDREMVVVVRQVRTLAQQNQALLARFEAESAARRDQSCASDERSHRAKVRDLRRTYRFLRDYPGHEFAPLIVQQLPRLEREAKRDEAPEFCDEPGVGLKEPDPRIPARPESIGP